MYQMKDEYKTGIDFIDEQHTRLFELADETYNLLIDEFSIDKYDKIMHLVNELKDYAKYHFKCEEEYMESISYKRMFTQKVDHAAFIEKFESINLSIVDENQDGYVKELLDFLNSWLIHHIFEKDQLIGKN